MTQETPQTGPHKRGPWTTAEIGVLRAQGRQGAGHLSRLLGRSETAVRDQARRLRISLRREGERRGLVLGQPRGESWTTRRDLERIREAMLGRKIDPRQVEDTLARLAAGDVIPLCPLCAARPVEHRSGVCRVCHLTALAQAHRDAEAVNAAQQDLWQARQAKSRSTRRTG